MGICVDVEDGSSKRKARGLGVKILTAACFILLPLVGSAVFSLVLGGGFDRSWYDNLKKPSWQPPSYLFGPVWTTLYLMMGTASYLVFRAGSNCGPGGSYFKDRKVLVALATYGANLLVNWIWSPLFFGAHEIHLALVDITLIWLTILASILLFWPYSRLASALMVPYLLWVTFATALNWKIWQLNRDSEDGAFSTTPAPGDGWSGVLLVEGFASTVAPANSGL